MDTSLFLPMLFGLQLVYWFVGKRSAKAQDYFLSEKNIRFFPLMMTFLATQVGGGVILGSADEAYQFGWAAALFPLGSALGLILLGSGIGRKWADLPISTTAQIFEHVYRSPLLRKVASALSILSLFMILVAQIIASHKFLIGLGICNNAIFTLFWAIVILYTVQGGLKAVISTDLVQALFFSVIFLTCFGFTFYAAPLPQVSLEISSVSDKLFGWLLMPLLFMMIEQDMGQRCFIGSSPKVVSQACTGAGVFTMIVCLVPVFFGCLAQGLTIPQGGSVLMSTISQTSTPWMTSLIGCAILAAIVSTATSLINAVSSNISHDFGKVTDPKTVKRITCIISISAIGCAFYFDQIVAILVQSYELSVSCLFVPIVFALFRKKGGIPSAWLSIVFGSIGFILFRIYPTEIPRELLSLALSFIGYGIGECFWQKRANW